MAGHPWRYVLSGLYTSPINGTRPRISKRRTPNAEPRTAVYSRPINGTRPRISKRRTPNAEPRTVAIPMNDTLKHPWVRVLLIATTVAMCSWALRETASITLPVVRALGEVLVPVAIGFCIAYVLTPIVDLLHRRWHLPRSIAAGAPFLLFLATVVLGTMLVVPTVFRQSSSLAERLFKGEPFTDLNNNDKWDVGEPFTDTNSNGRYDGEGMFDKALGWVRERQDRLRSVAGLDLDRPALDKLACVAGDLDKRLIALDSLLTLARNGQAQNSNPDWLTRELPPEGLLRWNAAWPGATADEVEETARALPAALRERWLDQIARCGRDAAGDYVVVIALLRAQRVGATSPNADGILSLAKNFQASEAAVFRQTDWVAAIAVRLNDLLAATAPDDEHLRAARNLAARLSEQDRNGQDAASSLLAELRGGAQPPGASRWLASMIASLESSTRDVVVNLPDKLGEWAKRSVTGFDWLLELGLNLTLIPIYTFFLILAMPTIRCGVRENLPTWKRPQILRIIRDIEVVVAAFFRGRLMVCLICGLITWLGFVAIGWFGTSVPYAVLFALLIGLATAIPFAGLLFLIPAMLLTLLEGGSAGTSIAMAAVYFSVQGLESLVLTPAIMGKEAELHPVTLIVGMLLCGKLFGVLGVILAVPIAASCRILAREFLWPRVRRWAGRPTNETVRITTGSADAQPPANN